MKLGIILAVLATSIGASAATFMAASCSETDVSTAIASASSGGGDTVVIPTCTSTTPGGSNTWTSTLSINKPLTIQGQDSPGGTGGGSGQTVLIDNVTKAPCTDAPLIKWTTTGTTAIRMTGITIQGDAVDSGGCSEHVSVETQSHAVRFDHLTFTLTAIGISIDGDEWGVVDHSVFSNPNALSTNLKRAIFITHFSWQNTGAWGDNSWASQDTMGATGTIANSGSSFPGAAMFVEANQFNFGAGGDSVGTVACDAGGSRCVVRFNNPLPYLGSHGTDSTQRARGVRQYEIYNNTITDNGAACLAAGGTNPGCTVNSVGTSRSGTALVFNNTITPTLPNSYNTGYVMESYRLVDGWTPWGPSATAGACDGEGPFDHNGGSNPVVSGTATSGSTTDSLVDNTKTWIANQWVGFSLRNATTGTGSYITGNTATTITTLPSTQGQPHNWSTGNTYHINSMLTCLDAPGRGQGNLISGGGNGIAPTPSGWVGDALDPIYAWSNNCSTTSAGLCATTGQKQVLNAFYPNLTTNTDYYDYSASFGGTTGVGVGTLAARPSTCTAGVGYWATDQGSWNSSGSGGQGELFVCTATNTWSLYYVPYAYPHPLTMASSPSVSTSGNVTSTGSVSF